MIHNFISLGIRALISIPFIIGMLLMIPAYSVSQKINSTRSKSFSSIYNDAIKQYLIHSESDVKKIDTLFVENRENYDDSILTSINGTVIKLLSWQEIQTKLNSVEEFTLHRFFSLSFVKEEFRVSVIPFRVTKNS